jgi:hypothetical protein
MFTGMVAGGSELLPGFDVQLPVQVRGLGAFEMYPFMEAGALTTPLKVLFFQYCEPQKSTVVPLVGAPAVTLPTTKSQLDGNDAVVSVLDALDDW